jgi:hypothetical protein
MPFARKGDEIAEMADIHFRLLHPHRRGAAGSSGDKRSGSESKELV